MAERHDIDDNMEPVDADPLQRFRAPAQTGQDGGAGTAREQDPHFSSLVAQAQFIVRRAEVAGLLEARRGRALGSEVGLAVGGNDPQPTSPPWVSAKAVLAELRFALRQLKGEGDANLRRAVEREYRVATKLFECTDSVDFEPASDEELVPGPVAAILLDRKIPDLAGEELAARVVQLLTATNRQTVRRGQRALVIAGALLLSVGVAATYVLAGTFSVLALMSLVALVGMLYAIAADPRVRYPQLDITDACALAYRRSGFTALLKSRPGPAFQPAETSTPIQQAVVPGFAEAAPTAGAAERERRIGDVHAAVAELDTEWLEYSLDTRAWFLSKPLLRNVNDPVIAAYREAHAELRDLADKLTSMSTDADITAAQRAARRALTAWGEANSHALKIGVSDLSPSEESALKRLHGLVNLLNDRSTPKAMWAELKDAIVRTMEKLTVTSFGLNVVADLPVIAEEARLQALPASGEGA